MGQNSTPARLGHSLGRLLAGRNPRARRVGQWGRAGQTLLQQVFGQLLAALRQIGLRIMGVLFLTFALVFGIHGFTSWRHLPPNANPAFPWILMGLGLAFAYFGLSSFFRALQGKR